MLRVDAKRIEKGDTFLALENNNEDILKAISNGAVCIVAEEGNFDVKTINVSNVKKYLSDYLKDLYGYKLKNIKIICVAGSYGKTASGYLLYQMLNKTGNSCAYINDEKLYFDTCEEDILSLSNLYELYEQIIKAIDLGSQTVVVESDLDFSESSLYGINFDIVGFTKIEEEDIEIINNIKGKKIVIDNEEKTKFTSNKLVTYGLGAEHYKLIKTKLNADSSDVELEVNEQLFQIHIPLVFKIGVDNYLLALSLANLLGISISEIIEITDELTMPKGILNVFKHNESYVMVDRANTAESIEKIIRIVKNYSRNIITLVGCDGNQSSETRAKVGSLVTRISKKVFFTNDNPQEIDEKKIIDDMISKVKKDNYEIIYNRKDAIVRAINSLEEKDILLILGRGNESFQQIGTEKVYLNDIEIVERIIK